MFIATLFEPHVDGCATTCILRRCVILGYTVDSSDNAVFMLPLLKLKVAAMLVAEAFKANDALTFGSNVMKSSLLNILERIAAFIPWCRWILWSSKVVQWIYNKTWSPIEKETLHILKEVIRSNSIENHTHIREQVSKYHVQKARQASKDYIQRPQEDPEDDGQIKLPQGCVHQMSSDALLEENDVRVF